MSLSVIQSDLGIHVYTHPKSREAGTGTTGLWLVQAQREAERADGCEGCRQYPELYSQFVVGVWVVMVVMSVLPARLPACLPAVPFALSGAPLHWAIT
jgi:hypothetical protein